MPTVTRFIDQYLEEPYTKSQSTLVESSVNAEINSGSATRLPPRRAESNTVALRLQPHPVVKGNDKRVPPSIVPYSQIQGEDILNIKAETINVPENQTMNSA